MRSTVCLLFVLGCGPTAASLMMDDGGSVLEETGTSKSDAETAEPLTWSGSRTFIFESYGDWGCEAEVSEEGREVTHDPEFLEAVSTCGDCDVFFSIDVTPPRICGDWVAMRSPAIRALRYEDEQVRIFSIYDDEGLSWSRDELAAGNFNDGDIDYTYEGQVGEWPFVVEGHLSLE